MFSMKKNMLCMAVLAATVLGATTAHADAIIYGGYGKSTDNVTPNYSGSAASFGVVAVDWGTTKKLVLGMDVGKEGTKLDSTYGRLNEPQSSTSFNLLAGYKLAQVGALNIDGAAILGFREESESCVQQSYVGYQCYANSEPETTYVANYGVAVFASYQQLMVGVRVTDASTQALFGFKF